MRTVDIERVIPAPIEEVFTFLTDAEHYRAMPGVLRAEVVVPGRTEPGGAGAVREVVLPMLKLTERIEVYEPPTFMRYRIVHSVPPLRHEHGFMAFDEVSGGTHVRWYSEFAVPASLLTAPLTVVAQGVIRTGFELLLRTAHHELTRNRRPGSVAPRAVRRRAGEEPTLP